MTKTFQSAEVVKTAEGRQYHISVAPGEIAPYILLCGDPARAYKVAKYFEKANEPITHREYVTITGVYKGLPISVMATGIGTDNTEIALIEISQVVEKPTLVRIGTCGALKPGIELGDLVISTGAVRLENTTDAFVVEGYPAVAHHEVVLALLESAKQKNKKHHAGLTGTASGFYGAQGRTVPGFTPRNPNLPKELEQMNVLNLEMESSCLFVLSQLGGFRSGAVCAAVANRHINRFIDSQGLEDSERACIEVGLGAMEILGRMDEKKGKNLHWLPSMGF